jgi:hypothetical protein
VSEAIELPVARVTSVSALRDYHKCGHYYKLKRIDKLPSTDTHHMAAGSLMHDAFYMAYAEPIDVVDNGKFAKAKWEVHGAFTPERALEMFEALWERKPHKNWGKSSVFHPMYERLIATNEPVKNFKPGAKASLKGKNQKELRAGWKQHFEEMLRGALKEPFKFPVVEIERRIEYSIGSTQAVGYIDVVLRDPADNGEIFVDLKSGLGK